MTGVWCYLDRAERDRRRIAETARRALDEIADDLMTSDDLDQLLREVRQLHDELAELGRVVRAEREATA